MCFEKSFDGAISGLCEELKSILYNSDTDVKERCSEIRLRVNKPLVLTCGKDKIGIDKNGNSVGANRGFICSREMIIDSFSRICDYSVHTHSNEITKGFITVKGGHRIGVTGTAVVDGESNITAVRDISSLCIRIAREIKGCAEDVYREIFTDSKGNVILAGPPSSGKTTVLRDLVRMLSDKGNSVALIDERQEIAPVSKGICFADVGINTDVYNGYPKERAINMAVRTMSPDIIAVDEICDENEVKAIIRAANCGVRLIVTLHADNLKDIALKYQSLSLLRTGVFDKLVILGCKNGVYSKKVYGIEEINDEIYRSRTYMDKLSNDGYEIFGAV